MKLVSQSNAVAKGEHFWPGGSLDNQPWQTEWKTAPMASVQLCEYENQTLEVFVLASPVFIPSLIFQYSGARGFLSP